MKFMVTVTEIETHDIEPRSAEFPDGLERVCRGTDGADKAGLPEIMRSYGRLEGGEPSDFSAATVLPMGG